MSAATLQPPPVAKSRAHDYLYDSTFIVSGAKDYARRSFQAAMASAQVIIQPVYKSMFSESPVHPRLTVSYHTNCRLPAHMDRSYAGYLRRVKDSHSQPYPEINGKHRFKFVGIPREVLPLKSATPSFHPPTPNPEAAPTHPVNRGMQTLMRESSAQTRPWQPDAVAAETCENTPEVLYLDKLLWGPGKPYRNGDLPADFHTTEIINKMRHARQWLDLVEKSQLAPGMKKRNAIITDVEDKDWLFREAEIDELQDIRICLLHKLQAEQRGKHTTRAARKLSKLWCVKKQEMQEKITGIQRSTDREIRKLTALHAGGGRAGLVQRLRAARGFGSVIAASTDPTSDLHAPQARNGYQARTRHAEITYDPGLLMYEDHKKIAEPPAWVEQCSQDLKKSCSGKHLPRDPTILCERETKWSEQFLRKLHDDLQKTRQGATHSSAGPLRVLKPRVVLSNLRPTTAEVDAVHDDDEACHQAALLLQRVVRGRAVHNLMYEGRMRAGELTEELKTTHGLQKEDKIRIAREEARARDYNVLMTAIDKKEDAITALVDELCGGAVSAALNFLEKELQRLKEERRQHAFILIALREKTMREAAEAGRRQKEEHRRREHDEMFKQVLGVTQESVDAYLQEIAAEGVALCAEREAAARAQLDADRLAEALRQRGEMSTAEQNELVAELVQQFLIPEAHKEAARQRIARAQNLRLNVCRSTIFGHIDDATVAPDACVSCGEPLGDTCHCRVCPVRVEPRETEYRHDPRWAHVRRKPSPPEKTISERFPPEHEFRCMLDTLVDEVVVSSRSRRAENLSLYREYSEDIRFRVEVQLEARAITEEIFNGATGGVTRPVKDSDYRYFMMREIGDALGRTEPLKADRRCPKELPSEIRRKQLEQDDIDDPTCKCERDLTGSLSISILKPTLLPSEIRALEEMMRCKCDSHPPTPEEVTVVPAAAAGEASEEPLEEPLATDSDSYPDVPFGDNPTYP